QTRAFLRAARSEEKRDPFRQRERKSARDSNSLMYRRWHLLFPASILSRVVLHEPLHRADPCGRNKDRGLHGSLRFRVNPVQPFRSRRRLRQTIFPPQIGYLELAKCNPAESFLVLNP